MVEPVARIPSRFADWRARLVEPWLVAAWPGMGGVAQIGEAYLARRLGAQPVGELPATAFFDARAVQVERGLIRPPQTPKNALLGWVGPAGGRNLVFFEAEAQPEQDGRRYCEALVAAAQELGVVRVCTFAAMATMIRPEAAPRVFAVASDAALLDEACRHGAEPLAEGSIGGLNGLLVGIAAQHGVGGICLLGEMPYFATSIANPKAAAAVLRVFLPMAGLSADLTELDAHAVAVERGLVEHLARAEQAAGAVPRAAAPKAQEPAPEGREREDRARIEALFAAAERDRARAQELKTELDRLGWFKKYEDRFLDLFRRGE